MKTEILKNIIRNFKQEDFFKIVNMHIHSTESDGKLTPLEIIKISQERGIKLISICDHNTVNAYRKTNILANDNIISGIEFDCWFKGILIHILGYNIDINNNEIKKLCAKNKYGTEKDIIRLFSFRSPQKIIQAIKNSGGIPVLAHPACYWAINLDKYIKSLIDMGLEGIETYYPYKRHRKIIKFHSKKTVLKIADKYQLLKTGGTDSHNDIID